MDGSIALGRAQRKRLLDLYRKDPSPCVRLRAHIILLLLSEGHAWSLVCAVLFCSTATVARWKQRFEAGGVDALLAERRGRRAVLVGWAVTVVTWVRTRTPRDFGYCRSRWCRATLAVVLLDTHGVRAGADTVRRWLRAEGMVWRRPRPVPGKADPRGAYKPRRVRELPRGLADDEAAVLQDEVDLNLNPGVGCMGMERGARAEVVTPGTNAKRYLAGSISWRTGELVETPGAKRDAALFVRHPDELRRRFRRYRVIHVALDNARVPHARGEQAGAGVPGEVGPPDQAALPAGVRPEAQPGRAGLAAPAGAGHPQPPVRDDRGAGRELTLAWLDEHGAFKIEGRMYERIQKLRDA
jgi:transposase